MGDQERGWALSLGEKMGMDQGGVVSGSRVYFHIRGVGSGWFRVRSPGWQSGWRKGGEAGTRLMVQETEVLPCSGSQPDTAEIGVHYGLDWGCQAGRAGLCGAGHQALLGGEAG